MSISPEQWYTDLDLDELDPGSWPSADVSDMPADVQWLVVERLLALGLCLVAVSSAAQLRLFKRGRRTLKDLHGTPPRFLTCPRWVYAMLLVDRSDPLRLLTDENVAAGEAVARMTPEGIDYMISIRTMLTGEPPPSAGGWRKT